MVLPIRSLLVAMAALGTSSWVGPAHGQTIDLASATVQYMPSATMKGNPGSVQVSSYDAAVNVPIPIGPRTFVVPGASYHVDAVSFADTGPGFVDLRAFQAFDVSTLMVQPLSPSWSIATRAALGVAGDFHGLDTRMLRASTLATVTHTFSRRFVLGGGGLTSFGFGQFLPLPAVYADWKPLDGVEIEGFLPAFIHARYTIERRVRFGVLAELSGNEYAVRDRRIRGAFPCVGAASDDPTTAVDERAARPAECFDNLAYSVGTVGLAVGVRLVSSVWLSGLVGHTFFRRLDRRNAARELLPEGRDEIPDVLVVRTAIVWRLPGLD